MNGKNLKFIVFNPGLTDKTFQLIRSIFSFRIEMKTSFERTEKRSNPWKLFHISLDFFYKGEEGSPLCMYSTYLWVLSKKFEMLEHFASKFSIFKNHVEMGISIMQSIDFSFPSSALTSSLLVSSEWERELLFRNSGHALQ